MCVMFARFPRIENEKHQHTFQVWRPTMTSPRTVNIPLITSASATRHSRPVKLWDSFLKPKTWEVKSVRNGFNKIKIVFICSHVSCSHWHVQRTNYISLRVLGYIEKKSQFTTCAVHLNGFGFSNPLLFLPGARSFSLFSMKTCV